MSIYIHICISTLICISLCATFFSFLFLFPPLLYIEEEIERKMKCRWQQTNQTKKNVREWQEQSGKIMANRETEERERMASRELQTDTEQRKTYICEIPYAPLHHSARKRRGNIDLIASSSQKIIKSTSTTRVYRKQHQHVKNRCEFSRMSYSIIYSMKSTTRYGLQKKTPKMVAAVTTWKKRLTQTDRVENSKHQWIA